METAAPGLCVNCSAPCPGAYCSACGEKRLSANDFSLRHFVGHAVHDLTHFDAKIFRSLIPLLFKPGVLTAEFIAGRRSRYIKPLTLFILVNLFFFVAKQGLMNCRLDDYVSSVGGVARRLRRVYAVGWAAALAGGVTLALAEFVLMFNVYKPLMFFAVYYST